MTEKRRLQIEAARLLRRANDPEGFRKKQAESKRKWTANNRERAREINKNYALRHPDRVKKQWAEYRKNNLEKINEYQKRYKYEWKISGKYRKYELMKSYGITPEYYDEILEKQNFCCAICRIEESKCPRRLFVDHNHKNGKVRGLLCITCNFLLGYSKDDIEILFNAVSYIQDNDKR